MICFNLGGPRIGPRRSKSASPCSSSRPPRTINHCPSYTPNILVTFGLSPDSGWIPHRLAEVVHILIYSRIPLSINQPISVARLVVRLGGATAVAQSYSKIPSHGRYAKVAGDTYIGPAVRQQSAWLFRTKMCKGYNLRKAAQLCTDSI